MIKNKLSGIEREPEEPSLYQAVMAAGGDAGAVGAARPYSHGIQSPSGR
jgi:hypothetical protein